MNQYIVKNCPVPMRLDRYVRMLLPSISQGIIEKNLRNKKITLNSMKSNSKKRVIDGDIILIDKNLLSFSNADKESNFSDSVINLAKKILTDYLLYENDEFIVINKPARLAAQGGSKIKISVDHALKYLNSTLDSDPIIGFRLVHRIDSETSGAMIIAKNKIAAAKLTELFKDRIIKKEYIAIISNIPKKNDGEIISYFSSDVKNKVQKIVSKDEINAKKAVTRYKIVSLGISAGKKYAIMRLEPITGRMHQLRLHCLELGSPILNDKKYKGENDDLGYLMLHAYKIVIDGLNNGEKIEVFAEPPLYYQKYLKNVKL